MLILNGKDQADVYQEVQEIEHHLHNREVWLGNTGVEDSLTPYTVTSGDGVYGSEVEILTAVQTPFVSGKVRFDIHRISPIAVSSASIYLVRLIWGTGTVAAAETAGQYTTVTFRPTGVGSNVAAGIADVINERLKSGIDKVWVKCKNATNAATITILVGVHEYDR